MKKDEVKELRRISKLVSAEFEGTLVKEEPVSPTIKKVAEMMIAKKDADPKLKRQLRHLRDAGTFDKTELVVNQKQAKRFDARVEEEIGKSIAAGRLPKPKDNTLFDKYIKKCKRNTKKTS